VALSDEQNAMLRLLARGEQGYADIAALMGLSEEEVRAKVVGALAQLQAEGKPAPDVPPPIVGGAKPAAEATAPEPEPPAEPTASAAPAEPAIADAVAPKPKPAAAAPTSPRPSAPPPSGGRTVTLPTGRKAWLLGGGVLAAIAVIVVVVVLVSGGDGDGSTTAATEGGATTAAEGSETAAGAKKPTGAVLTAVDGSEAEGRATFGRVDKDKLALQVEAQGLAPTVEGTNSYAIWLAQSPQRMLPLASIGVKGSGKGAGQIAAQFEVPVEILAYLAGGTFDKIAITKVDDKRFEAAVEDATKKKRAPTYTGEEVLRGTITGRIVGLAAREKEAKEAGK